MSAEALLAGLNEGQRLVATTLDKPVCVLAGAGTGKTRAITHRIAYAVQIGRYRPDNVLALTFTQKAAAEMASRVRELGAPAVEARTFHAAALRQLQFFWPQLTDGALPEVLPSKATLLAHVLETLRMEVDNALLRDIAAEIEWRKVRGLGVEEYLAWIRSGGRTVPAGLTAELMVDLMERYETAKDERRRIDFEDVLLAAVGMLEESASVAQRVRERFRHLVVDEYQDVSPIQQRLLELWLGEGTDVCVVGDASQTIYSFAGATSDYLIGFAEAFSDAATIRLDSNYRSSPDIVKAANLTTQGMPGALTLVAHTEQTAPITVGQLDHDEAESTWIAQQVQGLIQEGFRPTDIAILHRFTAQMLLTEAALQREGISVRIQGGARFFDQPHVKRAVMEIRGAAVAGTPGDVAQVVSDILFGLGLIGQAPERQGASRSTYEDLNAIRDMALAFPQQKGLAEFSEELLQRAKLHDEPDLPSVTLSTVHAAKGAEWPVVFVLGLSVGAFPISYAQTEVAIEEERRLFYVALTRAKKRLYLSWAARSRGGAGALRTMSPFLTALGVDSQY